MGGAFLSIPDCGHDFSFFIFFLSLRPDCSQDFEAHFGDPSISLSSYTDNWCRYGISLMDVYLGIIAL
jgi:hypothetical protein